MDEFLRTALRLGNLEEVKHLILRSRATDWSDKLNSAFLEAAHQGQTDTVRVLLAHKADVHAATIYGRPDGALRSAAFWGLTDMVCVLLEHKADVHACGEDASPDDALRGAASNGHTGTVRVLLAHQADVHACGSDGKPDVALRWAAEFGYIDTVRLLLEHKANVHACSHFLTQTSAEIGLTQMVEVLLEKGGPLLAQHISPSFGWCSRLHIMARMLRLYHANKGTVHALMASSPTPFTMETFLIVLESIVLRLRLSLSSLSSHCCRDLCELVIVYV